MELKTQETKKKPWKASDNHGFKNSMPKKPCATLCCLIFASEFFRLLWATQWASGLHVDDLGPCRPLGG